MAEVGFAINVSKCDDEIQVKSTKSNQVPGINLVEFEIGRTLSVVFGGELSGKSLCEEGINVLLRQHRHFRVLLDQVPVVDE